ncbi:ABC transporter permease, partial [Streptomyces sp. SID7982]|nr:ABC transporter permease [Streptomyces sp. SID7982]
MEKPSEPREPDARKPSGDVQAQSPRALTRARRRQAVARFWRQYRTHRAGLVGLAVLAVIALLALTAPLLVGADSQSV